MRERWIDNIKGVLIILVVLGHILPAPYNVLSTPASYIFLFHMPAFFMISGYLATPRKRSLVSSIWRKARRILGPYFFYLILIAGTQVLIMYIRMPAIYILKENMIHLFRGGQGLNNFYCGALWFLTCLFYVYVFFYLIERLPAIWMRGIVYVLLWVAAHYQSCTITQEQQATFWLWDVSVIGVVYLASGYYLKKYIFDKRVIIGSVICVIGFFVVRASGLIPAWQSFGIELWSHTYKYPILDFVIPCGIFVILANLIKLIPEGKANAVLSELGKYSLAIMAMHQIVIDVMVAAMHITNIVFLTVGATLIPYLIVRFIWAKIPLIKRIAF